MELGMVGHVCILIFKFMCAAQLYGDGRSSVHFNFQVHVRGTIVSATGVIQNAQETFRGLFRARKGSMRTFWKVEKFLVQSGEIYIS